MAEAVSVVCSSSFVVKSGLFSLACVVATTGVVSEVASGECGVSVVPDVMVLTSVPVGILVVVPGVALVNCAVVVSLATAPVVTSANVVDVMSMVVSGTGTLVNVPGATVNVVSEVTCPADVVNGGSMLLKALEDVMLDDASDDDAPKVVSGGLIVSISGGEAPVVASGKEDSCVTASVVSVASLSSVVEVT